MKRAVVLVVALLVSAFSGVFTMKHTAVASTGQTENTWETLQPMPTARSWLGVAVVNGKIYAIGGRGEGQAGAELNVNEMYDPATDTWTTKQSMPTPRSDFGIATYQNMIYCIGGITTEPGHTAANEVYDPATDSWSQLTSMPTAKYGSRANVVDGKIFMIGGRANDVTIDLNEVYDIASDTWTRKEPIPMPILAYASAVVDGKIYVFGGYGPNPEYSVWFKSTQIYDPALDSWSNGAQTPYTITYAAAGATTGTYAPKRIYVLGKLQEELVAVGTFVYDPQENSWSNGSSMPTLRDSVSIAVLDDVLYVIGGNIVEYLPVSVKVRLAVNERYTPFGYETVPPKALISSPQNNQNYNSSSIPLTFALGKPAESLSYSLDGGDKVAIAGNTTLTGLANGSHSIVVYATDESGNVGDSETITFSVDTPEPFPTTLFIAAVLVAVVVCAGLLLYFKRRKR